MVRFAPTHHPLDLTTDVEVATERVVTDGNPEERTTIIVRAESIVVYVGDLTLGDACTAIRENTVCHKKGI